MNPLSHTRKILLIAVVALVAIFALAFGTEAVTSSPRLCFTCHEMELRAQSWSESAHVGIDCVKCHQSPRAWYEVPQKLVDRGALLGRDVARHVSGDYSGQIDERILAEPISDAICLQCHDPNRKATSGFRIKIDHVEHAKRNGSCVSCHVRTAHPLESRGDALSLMGQCFTCHGSGPQAKAPADCDLCHPADYEPRPVSHRETAWATVHGKTALPDISQCTMCHTGSYCQDCHGLAMPHPAGWAKGETGHGGIAKLNTQVCGKCHGSQPDMCTMCHHSDYDPAKGTWVKQHVTAVRTQGTTYCLECHSPLFCSRCHVGS
jgi:nitrate/TMAO reductase-like tetraheme cytochrome c subunit